MLNNIHPSTCVPILRPCKTELELNDVVSIQNVRQRLALSEISVKVNYLSSKGHFYIKKCISPFVLV